MDPDIYSPSPTPPPNPYLRDAISTTVYLPSIFRPYLVRDFNNLATPLTSNFVCISYTFHAIHMTYLSSRSWLTMLVYDTHWQHEPTVHQCQGYEPTIVQRPNIYFPWAVDKEGRYRKRPVLREWCIDAFSCVKNFVPPSKHGQFLKRE
jgi:hypothetical protein